MPHATVYFFTFYLPVILLVLQYVNRFVNISNQQEVLESMDLMNVNIGINESNPVQFLILNNFILFSKQKGKLNFLFLVLFCFLP